MGIKEYLNEKLKDNKVAKKAVLTAATLGVLATGLAGCEGPKPTGAKDYYASMEDKLLSVHEEFDNLIEIRIIKRNNLCGATFMDQDVDILYELSLEQFQEIYNCINNLEDKSGITIQTKQDNVGLAITPSALKDERNNELSELIYNLTTKNLILDIQEAQKISSIR